MQARDLEQRIKRGDPPVIIDVRSGMEFRAGHIPGALHCPLFKVVLRMAKLPVDKQKTLVLTCEHGPRAQLAKAA